jgi:hypothetical protein
MIQLFGYQPACFFLWPARCHIRSWKTIWIGIILTLHICCILYFIFFYIMLFIMVIRAYLCKWGVDQIKKIIFFAQQYMPSFSQSKLFPTRDAVKFRQY